MAAVTEAAPRPRAGRRWWMIVSTTLSVALLLAVVAAASIYWPSRFGGSHAVVRVSGQSMEPTLHSGDIVIVRRVDAYALGDIVVYPGRDETGEVRGYVIHRVVGGDATSGYVTRGDNRTSDDVWRPTPADIDGKVVRTLVRGSLLGSVVSVLTQPLGLALIAAGLVFIAVWRLTARHSTTDVGAAPRRRRRGPVDGIPYGWVPAPPGPPTAAAHAEAVAAASVVPQPTVTAATVAELLVGRLQAEMASLDELHVRWGDERDLADIVAQRPVAAVG
jgi:signal peptidase